MRSIIIGELNTGRADGVDGQWIDGWDERKELGGTNGRKGTQTNERTNKTTVGNWTDGRTDRTNRPMGKTYPRMHNERRDGGMNEGGQTDERTNENTESRDDGRTDKRMNGWKDTEMKGWKDCMDGIVARIWQ